MTRTKAGPAIRLDLTHCDREAVHTPGSIQPHGLLLSPREPDLTALQVSGNVAELLERDFTDLGKEAVFRPQEANR
jgi:light-regulated signal transduction histidine kinase (bacteriophytochrome)